MLSHLIGPVVGRLLLHGKGTTVESYSAWFDRNMG